MNKDVMQQPQDGITVSEKILADLQLVFPKLSPQLRQAAQYLIDRPDEIAFTSMRQLAERAEVQPATMVRLAQADLYCRPAKPVPRCVLRALRLFDVSRKFGPA